MLSVTPNFTVQNSREFFLIEFTASSLAHVRRTQEHIVYWGGILGKWIVYILFSPLLLLITPVIWLAVVYVNSKIQLRVNELSALTPSFLASQDETTLKALFVYHRKLSVYAQELEKDKSSLENYWFLGNQLRRSIDLMMSFNAQITRLLFPSSKKYSKEQLELINKNRPAWVDEDDDEQYDIDYLKSNYA